MRNLIVVTVLALLSGCSKSESVTAGGKPVEYWFEALHSPDAKVRKTAAIKLGHVGPENPAVLSALIAALQDADAEVRCAAILALASFGKAGRDAMPALEELQRNDRNSRVRDYAARALAAMTRPQ